MKDFVSAVTAIVTAHSTFIESSLVWLVLSLTLGTPQVWMVVMSLCRSERKKFAQQSNQLNRQTLQQRPKLGTCVRQSLEDGNLYIFVITNSAAMLANFFGSFLYGNGLLVGSKVPAIFFSTSAVVFMLLATHAWTDARTPSNPAVQPQNPSQAATTFSGNMYVHPHTAHPLHMQPISMQDIWLSVGLASLAFISAYVVEMITVVNG